MKSNLYNNKYNNKYNNYYDYDSDATTITERSSSVSYSDTFQPYDDDNESVFSKLSDITDLSYNDFYNDYNNFSNYDNNYNSDSSSSISSISSTPRFNIKIKHINNNQSSLKSINEYESETESESSINSDIYSSIKIEEMLKEHNYNTIWNIYNNNKYKQYFNNINLNILSLFSRLILFIINPTYIFNENYETNYRKLIYDIDDKTKLIILNEKYNKYIKLQTILLFYALKIPTFFVISNVHFDSFYSRLLKYLGFISDTSNISISDELSTLVYDISYNNNKKINLLLMSNYENLQVCKVFNISNNLKSGIINIYYDANNNTKFNSYEYDEEEEIIEDIEFYDKENERICERSKLLKTLNFINIINSIISYVLKYILLVFAVSSFLNILNIIQNDYINNITYYILNILNLNFNVIKNNLLNSYYNYNYSSNVLFEEIF